MKSRTLRSAEHVAGIGETKNANRILMWKPFRIPPFERPRRRWEYNITMELENQT
jgi:hypothetical protein